MNLPENVNPEKLLASFETLGIRGAIYGNTFVPDKPLSQVSLAQVEQAIVAHDPKPVEPVDEYAALKPGQPQIDYIARLLGLIDGLLSTPDTCVERDHRP